MLTEPQNGNDGVTVIYLLTKVLGERGRQAVEKVTDWEQLVQTAVECKLVLSLAVALETLPECDIPEQNRDTIATLVQERTLTSVYLSRQLHLVLALLHSQGINAITYKSLIRE